MSEPISQKVRSHRILKSAGALSVVALFGLALSFLREVVIAAKIGAGSDVDAYIVASLYPTFLGSVFASTFGSTLVPAYHRTALESDLARDEFVSAAWTLSVLVVLAVTVLLGLFLGPLLRIATPGFDEQNRALAFKMAFLLLPTGVCNGLIAYQSAVLSARKSFLVAGLAVPLAAAAVTVAVLVFGDRIGVFAIVYGSLAGAVAGLLLLGLVAMRQGVRLRLVRRFWTPPVKHSVRLAAPLLVGIVATFGTVFVDRAMASSLGPGSIASLGYAEKVIRIPEAVIMGALPVVLFPYLSQSALAGDHRDLRAISTFGLALMVAVLIPVSVFCVAFSGPLTELLFQRGKFDVTAVHLTASALACYAFGLTFNGMGYVLPRILLALEKNYVIALLGCGNVVLKVIYNTLLIPLFGHAGIALGTSLMYATTDALFLGALLYYGIGLDVRVLTKALSVGAGLGVCVLLTAFAVDAITRSPVLRVSAVGALTAALALLVYRSPKLRALLLPGMSGV